MAPRACSCRGRLDPLGDHRAACANAGVLASRALTFERAVACVCQEAGARVARNARLADMMYQSQTTAASKLSPMGFPLWHGSQLAIDATIVSPVTRAGKAQPGADARLVGAARRNGRKMYPELVRARRCRLVVVGVEVGGRFSSEADTWLRLLARHRASAAPAAMQSVARSAWVARWSGLPAVRPESASGTSMFMSRRKTLVIIDGYADSCFFCHTFSSQSAVPVRGMTRSQTPRRPVAHCESPRQQKSTAGKNPRLTARPAGAVGGPAVEQRRSR